MTPTDPEAGNANRGFRVLHDSDTHMGRMMLRRRWSPSLECDVFEMTMDGKLMMSSAVVVSERALAQRALALLPEEPLRVLVGGLGFGFTVQEALADARVESLTVVERLAEVIEWHRSGVLPWSEPLVADPRLEIVMDDFFAFVHRGAESPYNAILIDIDDSPSLLWHDNHAEFYDSQSIEAVQKSLLPGGVFGLWCATHPGEPFVDAVRDAFRETELAEIHFENPCIRQADTNWVLLATT